MASTETPSKPTLIQRLYERRKPAAYGLCVLAAALVGVAIWLGVTWKWSLTPIWLWSGSAGLVALGAGLWLLLYEAPEGKGLDETRLMVLSLGGLTGLLTVCLGLVLGYVWWDNILAWMQPGGAARTGTSKQQWLAGLRALLPMPILLIGLAAMFASLQLARTEERSNPVLRRLFHGYNAVLTSLLLLLVLVVANVYVGVKVQKPLDFTSSTMFTLSDKSINILKHLEKPVKVFVIMRSSNSPETLAVEAMLANCREVNDRIQTETISENRNVNAETIDELAKAMPNTTLSAGLAIRYGPKDSKDVQYRFIKANDLFTQEFDRFGQGQPKFEFKGEDALMTQLDSMMAGKEAAKALYFLQGHGELDLKDTNPRSREGAGELKKRLEERNVTVKPLRIDVPDAKVPADAAMVVIAGPHNLLSDYALKALEAYMAKDGKMLVLLGPTPNRDKSEMVKTGLEPFLARYNVQVGNDRLLSVPSIRRMGMRMQEVVVWGDPQQREHPLVRPFIKDQIVLVDGTRPMEPSRAGPAGASRFRAESLLVTYVPAWKESNLSASPEQLFNDRLENRAAFQRDLETPKSVAVGVTEAAGPPPNPHAFMQPPKSNESEPRLVVIANSMIASNALSGARAGPFGYDFLASSMEWLRKREASIGIEPKKHQFFALPATTSFWPFFLMPTALILLGIVGLGTGVWLVRRR